MDLASEPPVPPEIEAKSNKEPPPLSNGEICSSPSKIENAQESDDHKLCLRLELESSPKRSCDGAMGNRLFNKGENEVKNELEDKKMDLELTLDKKLNENTSVNNSDKDSNPKLELQTETKSEIKNSSCNTKLKLPGNGTDSNLPDESNTELKEDPLKPVVNNTVPSNKETNKENKESKLTDSTKLQSNNVSAEKQPKKKQKARKSCQSSGPNVIKADSKSEQRAPSPSAVSALTKKTIKVAELESVLGIKNRSLDTMDAKTLDMLVVRKAQQHKSRFISNDVKPLSDPPIKQSPVKDTSQALPPLDTHNHLDCKIEPKPLTSPTANLATVVAGQQLLGRSKKRKAGRFKGGRYSLPGNKKVTSKKVGRFGRRRSSVQSQDSLGSESVDTAESVDGDDVVDETLHSHRQTLSPPIAKAPGKVLEPIKKEIDENAVTKEGKVSKLKNQPTANQPKIDAMFKKQPITSPVTQVDSEVSFVHKSSKSLALMEHTPKVKTENEGSDVTKPEKRKWRRKRKLADEDASSIASSMTSTDDAATRSQDDADDSAQAPKRRRVAGRAPRSESGADDDVTKAVTSRAQPPLPSKQVTALRAEFGDTDSDDSFAHLKNQVTPIKSCPQGMKFVNTPNGLTYPVTPPKTPESSASSQVGVANEERVRQTGSEGGRIPESLCCCKMAGTVFAKVKLTYCHALDSVDGKTMACFNKVTNSHMVRASVRVPFMALCEVHRHRFKQHQCCPGCGQFCTQGAFIQCSRENNPSVIHHFHTNCQVRRDDKCFCPHCGQQSAQNESHIESSRQMSLDLANCDTKPPPPNARISLGEGIKQERVDQLEDGDSASVTSSDGKLKLSTKGMIEGPSKRDLQSLMQVFNKDDTAEKPGYKYRKGHRNLYHACRAGDTERVLFLLLEGCDPNTKYEEHDKQTALHIGASKGHLTIVHLLLQAGAVPHCIDEDLKTPLMCAAENCHSAIARMLAQSGSLIDFRASDGMTAVHLAAKSGDIETVRMIITAFKINVNCTDEGGWTPLIWAAEFKHLDVIKYLMQVGSDPNVRDDEGNTGLHWACYSGSTDIAVVFLNAGCDIEAANVHGDRPLHIAARQRHLEVVNMLLARNADSLAKNNNNATPSDCVDESSQQLYMTLQVNKQLKTVAAKVTRPQRLLHRDVSMGKEQYPIPIVNEFDDENYPIDYQYVVDYVESSPMNVNRVITSLQACECKDNCSTLFCKCGRNSVRCWYNEDGRLVEEFNYAEPPFVYECNRQCRCWANCQNRVVQLGISVRLQVFRCPGKGWGVHSLLDIPKGTYVCEYIGELLSDAEADKREDDSYLFDLDNRDSDSFCIDARHYGNVSRFINHSCDPNLIPVKVFVNHQDLRFPRICFFARREIKAYEELGFDYCEKFWIIKYKQFTCECGAAKCNYSSSTIHKTVEAYHKRQEAECDSS